MKNIYIVSALVIAMGVLSACTVSTPRLTPEDINDRINRDRAVMFEGQDPVMAPITLEEAMARAIKYNIEHRIKIMEDALTLQQSKLMTYDMLPRVVLNAGYSSRDSYDASTSLNLTTGNISVNPTTSTEKSHSTEDLSITWNILDFGVSYFQAKQQAERVHIMQERRRKVVHSIMQEVRLTYWQAYGAQELGYRLDELLNEVEKALNSSSSIELEKLRPAMESLSYRKSLLEIMKQVEVFRAELAQAKPRLATLMNLPPGQSYELADNDLIMPKGPDSLKALELLALTQRPELIEADYNQRISVYETRKTVARMFPGFEISTGIHRDSNDFLVNQKWVDNGARLTWNLMNLFSASDQYKLSTSQEEITREQRLALSIAIITQVHVAYQNFYSQKRQFELSKELQIVDSKIYQQVLNESRSGAGNRMNEIRSATSALMAEYRSYQNYAALQGACGRIIASLGDDPLPETVPSHETMAIAAEISKKINDPDSFCAPIPGSQFVPVSNQLQPLTPPRKIQEKAVGSKKAPIEPLVFSMNFDNRQFQLTSAQKASLNKYAVFFEKCPDAYGEISGHADSAGSADNFSNKLLSERRADAVSAFMIDNFGVDPSRISKYGFGSSKPVASNDTEQGRAKNRRADINIFCDGNS